MPVLHPLRTVRRQQNLTIEQLAQNARVGASTIWRAEHGYPINAETRRRLCAYFDMTSRELGLVGPEEISPQTDSVTFSIPDASTISSPPAITPAGAVSPARTATSRKQQVGEWLVRVTGEMAALFDVDWSLVDSLQVILQCMQRLPPSTRQLMLETPAGAKVDEVAAVVGERLSLVDRDLLHDTLKESVANIWHLFHTSPPAHVLVAAQAQLYVVHNLYAAIPKELRHCLNAALYNLIGGTLFSQGHYAAAQRAHQQAYLAATEVADVWNMAQSLSWQSIISTKHRNYAEATGYLEKALGLVEHEQEEQYLRLRAHLLADWAYNAALHHEQRLSREKLDVSSLLLEGLGPSEEFDRARWFQIAGNCFLLQGDYGAAIARFEESLAHLPPTWLARRVLTLMPLAEAHALHHEREASIAIAEQATALLRTLDSSMLNECLSAYQQILQQVFPKDPRVRAFIGTAQ
jgi:tetratricopeptide (TPR) repeat protein/transcriptional regulator with XRE-family HTH domain